MESHFLSILMAVVLLQMAFTPSSMIAGQLPNDATSCSSLAPTAVQAPLSSASAPHPRTLTPDGLPSGSSWGVTVNGVRYISNQSALTLDGLAGVVNYSYDCTAEAQNGTTYHCVASCSGTVAVAKPVLSRLHVDGNAVRDDEGRAVVLHGVVVRDGGVPFGWSPPIEKRLGESDYVYLAQQWDVQIVRFPVTPIFWRNDSNYLSQVLEPEVQWANENGAYAIIDWHGEGDINHPGQGTNSGNAETNVTETLGFWSTVSQRFAGQKGVIYEIFNEPGDGITWDQWKPVAQQVVDEIRRYDNSTLILIGGPDWSYDLSGVASNPVVGSNLVYTVHPYSSKCGGDASCWDTYFGNTAKVYPVWVTEWGYYTPDQVYDTPQGRFDCISEIQFEVDRGGYSTALPAYMEARNMTWMAWGWDDTWCPVMITNWAGYKTTQYGSQVESLLTELAPPPVYSSTQPSAWFPLTFAVAILVAVVALVLAFGRKGLSRKLGRRLFDLAKPRRPQQPATKNNLGRRRLSSRF